jgi:hypothetical protein
MKASHLEAEACSASVCDCVDRLAIAAQSSVLGNLSRALIVIVCATAERGVMALCVPAGSISLMKEGYSLLASLHSRLLVANGQRR